MKKWLVCSKSMNTPTIRLNRLDVGNQHWDTLPDPGTPQVVKEPTTNTFY